MMDQIGVHVTKTITTKVSQTKGAKNMSKDWNYAKLVEDVARNGGPERWLASIKTNSYNQGATDMKNAVVIPVLAAGVGIGIMGVKVTEYIIRWVREKKEKMVLTEQEAIQAEKYLLAELETSIQEIEEENEQEVENKESALLKQAIEQLPELEKRIIKMAYHLEPNNNDTCESLAQEFSITVEEICEIQTNALRLLRNVNTN